MRGTGKPAPEERPSQTDEAPSAAPAPVFAVDPYPDGWYPAEDGRPPVPVMAARCRRARVKATSSVRKTA